MPSSSEYQRTAAGTSSAKKFTVVRPRNMMLFLSGDWVQWWTEL
jgi:hypothetical protein